MKINGKMARKIGGKINFFLSISGFVVWHVIKLSFVYGRTENRLTDKNFVDKHCNGFLWNYVCGLEWPDG